MKQTILDYLNDNFPDLWSDINIRFELGEPHPNGSDERIEQVNKRATTIFEEVLLKANDSIFLYIKDWNPKEDIMFGNTTPDYIYKLLEGKPFEEEILYDLDEDEDDEGNKIQVRREYLVRILSGYVTTFPYKKILEGISHYEQGREPSIGQSIYFINKEKQIIFHMYDDRGCIIYAKSKEYLRKPYTEYNDWIVDYWREYFDRLFEDV
ncbi:DUF3885 domain-containing protein [Cohnella boryungensis]|uniref:DUF3885 domain-containing protein n=1 Tax=Cohnella boryungensis TaxID=768479 RepID=A0ABV8SGM6_9BACL